MKQGGFTLPILSMTYGDIKQGWLNVNSTTT